MRPSSRPRLPRCTTLATSSALLLASLASLAPANVVIADYNAYDDFSYHIQYMPDLDQRRNGIPGNGSAFCVPTSTLNMLSYAAEWGVDTMDPGPGVYNFEIGYNTMTNHLDDLGVLMGTTVTCGGTCLSDWHDGLDVWMSGEPLIAHSEAPSEDHIPQLHDLNLMAAFGGLVSFAYGRYEYNTGPCPFIGDRTGGHAVTMMYAQANGPDDIQLWVRDPADDSNLNSQSAWAYRIYDPLETMMVYVDYDGDGVWVPKPVTAIEFDPSDSLIRFVDYSLVLFPSNGFSFDTVQVANIVLSDMDFTVGPRPTHFDPPSGFFFSDVAMDPAVHSFWAVSQGSPNEPAMVSRINRVNGEREDLLPIWNAQQLAVGRKKDVYVSTGDALVRAQMRDGVLAQTGQRSTGVWIQDIGYDDSTDQVIGLSTWDSSLVVTPRDLGTENNPWFVYPLPSEVPTSAEAMMSIHPRDSRIAVWTPTQPHQVSILSVQNPGSSGQVEAETIASPNTRNTTGVDFDDRGHLLLTKSDGTVLELRESSPGSWRPVRNSMYADVQASGEFRVARSRSSFDPEMHQNLDRFIPMDELPEVGRLEYDETPDRERDEDHMRGVVEDLGDR